MEEDNDNMEVSGCVKRFLNDVIYVQGRILVSTMEAVRIVVSARNSEYDYEEQYAEEAEDDGKV